MLKIYSEISKAIYSDKYKDLGNVELKDSDDITNIKIKVIPREGIHKNKEYLITLNFYNEVNNWPIININSEIFDKIKTRQYIENKGFFGNHKGICIKNISYGYSFTNFTKLCNNEWKNYLYYVICMFNNFEDFIKGSGIKSNYKQILKLHPNI